MSSRKNSFFVNFHKISAIFKELKSKEKKLEEAEGQKAETDDDTCLDDGDLSRYEIAEDSQELSLPEKVGSLTDLTVDAIKNAPAFSDFFDNISLVSCYGKGDFGNKGKAAYIVFRANDAVSGRRVVVKCTNPIFTSRHEDGGRALENALEWEEAAIRLLGGKKRCVVLNGGVKSTQIQCDVDGKTFRDRVTFLSTIFLPFDVKKCFFDKGRLGERKSLEPERALRIMAEILRSIQTLHRAGICHRDLKPANLMGSRRDGTMFISAIDLESSIVEEGRKASFPRMPQFSCTRAYAAPEMLSGLHNDFDFSRAADWYAAGCMLFELFDGRAFYPSFIEENGKKKYASVMNNIYVHAAGKSAEKCRYEYFGKLDSTAHDILLPEIRPEKEIIPEVLSRIEDIYEKLAAFDVRKRAGDGDIQGIKDELLRLAKILENRKAAEFYRRRKDLQIKRRGLPNA